MKKRLYLITTILLSAAALSLSSCLKDKKYVDFASGSNIVYFPLGGTPYFSQDAITEAPDTDANGTIVRQFSVGVATPNPTTSATTVTLAIDTTLVAKYNAANTSVTYLTMPADAYSYNTSTVTIPAGKQYATVSVTFYKNKLDPSKSYMLPIKIAGNSGGYKISGNMGIHYYHFIGNDFAGIYQWQFTRTPPAGNFTFADGVTTTFLPDSRTQFEVAGGYYTGDIRYVVSFTETGAAPNATYTNFQISINADDVTRMKAAGINITAQPTIVGYDPTHSYTYAEALTLFTNGFTYAVLGGSGARTNLDQFQKP
jgi:hypothetical protein